MTYPIKSPRKLIEVALPLDAINAACGREKSIRHGHPSTLHLWWARRPLAAARAVIFAQLVNDPGYQQGGGFKYGKNKKDAAVERQRLFRIIEDLVKWESTEDEEVLERARAEIRRSWNEICDLNRDHPRATDIFNSAKPPGLHDPFAGGGAIPVEALRLGLDSVASDLNPVAVVINKAMVEIPPRFARLAPIGPDGDDRESPRRLNLGQEWTGATGLAEDVRRYGAWLRSEAQTRIGHLYPTIDVTPEMARGRPRLAGLIGRQLKVIAWIWTRTVKSPNPAFASIDVPLTSSFVLSSKAGNESYIEPVIAKGRYHFEVRTIGDDAFDALRFQEAAKGTKAGKAQDFRCVLSGSPISREDIRGWGKAHKLGRRLMAIVADDPNGGRVYLPPLDSHEKVADSAAEFPSIAEGMASFLSGSTPTRAMITGGVCSAYGLSTWGHLFTPRQVLALTTFSDLVTEARDRIKRDALAAGMADDGTPLDLGGAGATAYAEAISVYLALAVDKTADYNSALVMWSPTRDQAKTTFSRQALPMVWDFAELNMFADAAGDLGVSLDGIRRSIRAPAGRARGVAVQADAQLQTLTRNNRVSTDPPYYDNIGYADLSEFFYVWLRRSLRQVFPNLFATLTVPKADELVATLHRHGTKERAEDFFLAGMTNAMTRLTEQAHPEGPLTIYYAFKQSETATGAGTSSTGWETFLAAVLRAGLQLTGTWPIRTERESRSVGIGTNSLASSIVLVCRRRHVDAPSVSRREFLRELNAVLPEALDEMTKGSGEERSPVAPVDLSQAIIGPGMAVFSKYSAVLEADGTPMTVRAALQLINRFLAEDDFDTDTQFCLRWFEQNGWKAGKFGDADTLARAKGTSVQGVKEAGVVESGGGSVRLLKWSEYASNWDPTTDSRNPVWETLHHLIRALKQDGESGAGRLLTAVKEKAEPARQLAYRLYTLCERQGWAEDARAYNELITSWSGIEAAAGAAPTEPAQRKLFD